MSPGSRNSGTPSMIARPMPAIARPTRTRTLPNDVDQLDAGEEVPDFVGRRVGRVGSVRRVALDRLRELLPQRAGVRLGGIGRTHQRAPHFFFLPRVALRVPHTPRPPRS